MTKTRISADELVHILHKKLHTSGKCPRAFPIAVLPNKTGSGWTAVAAPLPRSRHPACTTLLARLEQELQAVYVLRQ